MTAELTWRAQDVAQAVQAKSPPAQNWQARGVAIDSRTVEPGDLFIALKGPAHDGHDHAAAALKAGAVAAIVSKQPPQVAADAPLLVVADTMKALEDLGAAGRRRARGKIVAVTGSVGKTGTKEMLRLMLSADGETYANEGSFNNQWGVPLSLARLPEAARFGVFELGMNHAGELGPLSQQAQPHVALITTIEPVHLEFFSSVEAIADAKAEIFLGMSTEGVAVLNRDNPHFARLDNAAAMGNLKRILGFGRDKLAEARLLDCRAAPGGSVIDAEIFGRKIAYRLGAPGEHLALNSLGALLAAAAAGADLEACAAALAHYHPPKGRGVAQTIRLANGEITLIDESYNASPVAVRAAIHVLEHMPGGRRIMALGDMRELGSAGPRLHAELATDLVKAKIDRVYCCGELMAHLHEALPPALRGGHAKDSAALAPQVAAGLRAGDTITVKGSKTMMMNIVIEAIKSLAALAALIFLTLIPSYAHADDDGLAADDWSVTASQPLDKYAPAHADLQEAINRTIDSDWTMNICSYKFTDVYDGAFRLVASLDVNGRHACNEVVVIAKTGALLTLVNKIQAVTAENVNDMLRDIDGDHVPELVVTQAWSRPEAGHCTATWERIYQWHEGRFVDRSSFFTKLYRERLKQLQDNVAYQADRSCYQMEMDRIGRLLGSPKAGYDRAVEWMKSPDASQRRKAATVFADIHDESSKKNLALLSKDADPLTAESARLYLETSN